LFLLLLRIWSVCQRLPDLRRVILAFAILANFGTRLFSAISEAAFRQSWNFLARFQRFAEKARDLQSRGWVRSGA